MLLFAGIVRIDPVERDEVTRAAIAVMQETRKLPGCISFVISTDLEDASVLHLFEQWESPEAVEAHLSEPRVEAFRLRLGSLGVREIAVSRYAVQSVGPLV